MRIPYTLLPQLEANSEKWNSAGTHPTQTSPTQAGTPSSSCFPEFNQRVNSNITHAGWNTIIFLLPRVQSKGQPAAQQSDFCLFYTFKFGNH
jgi:hypothetical protein